MSASAERHTRRRLLTPGRAVTALVILAAAVLFIIVLTRTANSPTTQVGVDMGSMGKHLVNIWMDPDPPRVGSVTVVAQVVDQGGNPRASSAINFLVGRGQGGPVLEKSGEPMDAGDRTEFGRFRALLDFTEAGGWWMDVVVQMSGQRATVRIPVQVAE